MNKQGRLEACHVGLRLVYSSIVPLLLNFYWIDQEELLGKKLKRRKEKTIEVNRKGLKYNEDNSFLRNKIVFEKGIISLFDCFFIVFYRIII
jgi:hypothetical protein